MICRKAVRILSERRQKKRPLRTCVACREKRDQRELMRITASKDGVVTFDSQQKLPGRGAYLCYRRECVEKAKKRDLLRRALKCPVPEEIWKNIDYTVADVSSPDEGLTRRMPENGVCMADIERKGLEGVDRQEE
ncbi:MAG: YlxR family protein [Clostridiaceae bacterium]|jgi:predicted RNA-binding protein YlxR (DUF448 family)|nr:YlxR family protein [Clostridia bacterium]MBP6161452.1 YlxR family protein [Clostridia bacterium]MBP6949417.1 YlxR family protein [Clostridia bacterium]NMA36435.1 YlxR family protein [Clostridiaceae bacterium]